MNQPDNIFEILAEKLEEDRKKAFIGLPSSSKYLTLSDSTNTKEIGSQFPQTNRIDLSKAHSIKFHQLNKNDLVFTRIDLYKSAKLTDNISTAAISAHAFLLSKKALDVFLNFDLGNYKIHPALVYHQGIKNEYGILHFVNDFKDEINYKESKFYISTILGSYQEDIEINSQDDYKKKWHLVNSGEYPNTENFGVSN